MILKLLSRHNSRNLTLGLFKNIPCCSYAEASIEQEDAKKRISHNLKGTVDHHPLQAVQRQQVIKTVTECFQRHGAKKIETPVLELREVLLHKYGEESKLIFDVCENDEMISMRYDLTVPFARYLAMNDIINMKCYHIGKVYRRENTSLISGRYREFYQCDFDIAGEFETMVPDSECIKIITEILTELEIKDFFIKVNHREILNGLFEICGIPLNKFTAVCYSIDKLDKKSWEEIRHELLDEIKLTPQVVNSIGYYIQMKGNLSILEKLSHDNDLSKSKSFANGLESICCLLRYCQIFGIEKNVIFDFSLARGLDYYTGVVFEAVINVSPGDNIKVGSIAGGGRYDNLVSLFHPERKQIPCIGLSIGIERIALLLSSKLAIRTIETDVYVASPQKHFLEERMKLTKLLWDADIKCEMAYKKNPKLLDQLQHCEKMGIPWAIIIGESELENNVVIIRDVETRKEIQVPRENLIEELKRRLK